MFFQTKVLRLGSSQPSCPILSFGVGSMWAPCVFPRNGVGSGQPPPAFAPNPQFWRGLHVGSLCFSAWWYPQFLCSMWAPCVFPRDGVGSGWAPLSFRAFGVGSMWAPCGFPPLRLRVESLVFAWAPCGFPVFFHVMVWAPAGLLSRFAPDPQLLRGVHVGSLCFPTSWCGSASDYASVWCGLHGFPRNGVVCPMCVPWLFPRNGVASMWALIVGPAAIF